MQIHKYGDAYHAHTHAYAHTPYPYKPTKANQHTNLANASRHITFSCLCARLSMASGTRPSEVSRSRPLLSLSSRPTVNSLIQIS
ncbi:hypothetical protein EON63_07805 [archaeon]|nr:MAG: hypothetical protein EON63_07805 [archaeon]